MLGHKSSECRLRGCVCHNNCGKKNHISKVCRDTGKSNNYFNTQKKKTFNNRPRPSKHHYVEEREVDHYRILDYVQN